MKHFFQTVILALIVVAAAVAFNSCKKEILCDQCPSNPSTNISPIAVAGPDQTITLPTDSILLNGSASNDTDGRITAWQWTKIAGSSSFIIVNASNVNTQVKHLVAGTYLFELKVTDNGGLVAKDTVQVRVRAEVPGNNGSKIFIAGYAMSTGNMVTKIARISKDGNVQDLSSGQYNAEAKSVYVSGSDIYVAGFDEGYVGEYAGNAILWKNGVAQNLTNGRYDASANSVFVSGSDVYVAGTIGKLATVWKNGVAHSLNDGQHYASANSVFVSGSDVYVAGEDGGDAILWKNGVAQNLGTGAIARSVFVSGNDVYVAGTLGAGGWYPTPVLWKNGVLVFRIDYSVNREVGFGNSLFVSGNDVYIGGLSLSDDGGGAAIWKNGQVQYLGGGVVSSVFVLGNDVYAAQGINTTYPGNVTASLWKNGVEYSISGLAVANSVFVQ
jgi:hypothetical protein